MLGIVPGSLIETGFIPSVRVFCGYVSKSIGSVTKGNAIRDQAQPVALSILY